MKRKSQVNKRAVTAVVSCVFGIGLILFGFSVGSNPQGDRSAPQISAAQGSAKKSLPKWNVALGNVVMLAPELGFSINGTKEEEKITTRIETQLITIRQLYREESENNASLMGHIRLQFTIGPSGAVTQVKELSSRITDTEFKKAVLAEVSKWQFPEIDSESVTINCPLLFVREGMDITSVTMWEKELGHFEKPASAARKEAPPASDGKTAQNPNPVKATAKPPVASSQKSAHNPAEKAARTVYQVKYPTAVRKGPDFSAPFSSKLTPGTKVTVIRENGQWLEVRSGNGGSSGFIRKEFVDLGEN